MRTALYRHYDQLGLLLYVGVAGNPHARFQQHKGASPWAEDVVFTRYQWFSTRDEALAAETDAIRNEHPAFNVQGRKTYAAGPLWALVDLENELADGWYASKDEAETWTAKWFDRAMSMPHGSAPFLREPQWEIMRRTDILGMPLRWRSLDDAHMLRHAMPPSPKTFSVMARPHPDSIEYEPLVDGAAQWGVRQWGTDMVDGFYSLRKDAERMKEFYDEVLAPAMHSLIPRERAMQEGLRGDTLRPAVKARLLGAEA